MACCTFYDTLPQFQFLCACNRARWPLAQLWLVSMRALRLLPGFVAFTQRKRCRSSLGENSTCAIFGGLQDDTDQSELPSFGIDRGLISQLFAERAGSVTGYDPG